MTSPASGESSVIAAPRTGFVLAAVATSLLALVALLGDSAAVPGLGAPTALPPWDFGVRAPSWLVTVLVDAGYLIGGVAVVLGLRSVRAVSGAAPAAAAAKLLLVGGIAAAFALTLVPPMGSADHLSYLAYGRIAQAGDDAYLVPPGQWHGGTDPVAGAVQPPWQNTPSVYGPVAVQAFRLIAEAGGGSLRASVWLWSLVCAASFAAVGLMLHYALAAHPTAQLRAAVLWTANPLLLGELVLGAHVDVLAVAFAVAGLLLAVRVPLIAGALLGAAAAVKAPYALFAIAALFAVWTSLSEQFRWRAMAYGVFGAAVVAGPAYAWAGPHAFDQSRVASGFTSLASPWRAVANLVDLIPGASLRPVVLPLALVVAAVFAWRLWRFLDEVQPPAPGAAVGTATGVRLVFALTAAWVVCAPYALPWYDAMLWAPLALAGIADGRALPDWRARTGSRPRDIGELFAVRLTVLAIAYVPGRVVELSPMVQSVTLGLRGFVAPLFMLGAAFSLWQWASRRPE